MSDSAFSQDSTTPGEGSATSFGAAGPGPPPWSAAAIASFVLSLLGFLGFTAILGLIFGVVGLITTRGGRRRGVGLAIAALPLSVVTGLLGLVTLIGLTLVGQVMVARQQLQRTLVASPDEASLDGLLGLCSDDLRAAVTRADLARWVETVYAAHGSLMEIEEKPTPQRRGGDDRIAFSFEAKFVDGPGTIDVIVQIERWWRCVVSDIAVDGVPLRGGAEAAVSD